MKFRILGPLEVIDAAQPVTFGGVRQRAVLAVLLLSLGRVVSVNRLVDEIWDGTPTPSARKTLHTYVSQLRMALEPERPPGARPTVLITQEPGYVLRVEPDRVDAYRFDRLLSEGQSALAAGRYEAALRKLHDALSLWRGPALAEFGDYGFARAEATRLEQRRLDTVESRIEAELALGRHRSLIAELESLITAHPLRESLHGLLMIALYRSGRQADALTVFRDLQVLLDEREATPPTRGLQDLYLAILDHNPSLDRLANPARGRIPRGGLPVHGAALNNLAVMLVDRGEYEEGYRILKQLVEQRQRTLGKTHAKTLLAMDNLAAALSRAGRYDEALALLEEVLALRQDALPRNHPDTLLAMNNLAATLTELRQLGRARLLHEQALDARREVLGPQHPDTLASMNNLGETLAELGELDAARLLYEQILATPGDRLSDEDPLRLATRHNHAATVADLGGLDEALEAQEALLADRGRVLGVDHPDTLTTKSNVATTLARLDRLEEARTAHHELLEARRRVLGEDHPDTLATVNNLMVILARQGKVTEAMELSQFVFEATMRALDDRS